MGRLRDVNAAAREVVETWPHPDPGRLNEVANALSGKEEERHQVVVATVLRMLQKAGVVSHFTVVPNEAMRPRWSHWATLGAQKGTPDLVVSLAHGPTVWMERKSEDGKMRPEQEEARARLLAGGHHHIVPRSAGEDVCELARIWREYVV